MVLPDHGATDARTLVYPRVHHPRILPQVRAMRIIYQVDYGDGPVIEENIMPTQQSADYYADLLRSEGPAITDVQVLP